MKLSPQSCRCEVDDFVVATVLVIVAHPDDCEFRCGGTVAKWAARGATVKLVVVTDGARGSHDTTVSDEHLSETRQREQQLGASRLGVGEVVFLNYPDGLFEVSEETLERVVDVIRTTRPDILVTHDPWAHYQLHPDHRAVGDLALTAFFRAGEPRLTQYAGVACRPRECWLFAAAEPNHVEDISEWFDVKLESILLHESQYETSMGFKRGDEVGQATFVSHLGEFFAALGNRDGYSYGEDFRRVTF
jgi:LmbE family N-acetylglucosaminyl deacetylase